MTTTECATDISVPASHSELWHSQALPASPAASKPPRRLLLSFAFIVAAGLTLASWYVGVRIIAADAVATINSTPAARVNSLPPMQVATPIGIKATASWYPAPAPRDHFYLQAAGIGPKQDASFIRSLRAKGFHVQVQPGEGRNAGILIGPFSTRAETQAVQRKLQSAGVLAVETAN
jgi:cell division protein FtsN